MLPSNIRYFENIKIIDMIDSYDGPKVFTFMTQSGDYYLSYFCDDDATSSQWLYFPVDQYKLEKLLEDKISVRDFFQLCGISYFVKTNNVGAVISSERKLFEEIDALYIPEADVYLEKPISNLTIKIVKEGISPANIPDNSLVRVVSGVHKAIKKVMREIKKADISYSSYSAEPQMALSNIAFGSVELKLKPIGFNPLLAETLSTFQKVIALDTGVNPEMTKLVQKELYEIAPNSKSKQLNFDKIVFSGSLSNSHGDTSRVSFELKEEYRTTYSSFQTEIRRIEVSIILRGIIREFDRDNETFTLRNLDTNANNFTEVSCSFDSDSLELFSDISEVDLLDIFTTETRIEVSGTVTGIKLNVMNIKRL